MILVVNDALLVAMCLWIAFFLRIGIPTFQHLSQLVPLFILITVSGVFFLWVLQFYRNMLREMEIRDFKNLIFASIFTSILIAAYAYFSTDVLIPRSIPGIFGLLMLLAIASSRAFGRWCYQWAVGLRNFYQPIVVYGAGTTGTNAATILDNSREFSLVGFIDDDTSLHGSRIKGRRISGIERLQRLVEHHKNLRVLICIGNLSSLQRRKIIERLQAYPVQVLKIPTLSDVIAGRPNEDSLQQVKLQDLLGREQVPPIDELFHEPVSGKTTKDADNPDGEISIEFTGLRHGEKLYEELHLTDDVTKTAHPKIMAANDSSISYKKMAKHLKTFTKAVDSGDANKALMLLSELVEEYKFNGQQEDK